MVGQSDFVCGKAEFSQSVRRHHAVSGQFHEVEHLGAVGNDGQLPFGPAGRGADCARHGGTRNKAGRQHQNVRRDALGVEQAERLAQRLFEQRNQRHLFFVLIEQDAQDVLAPDIRRVAEDEGRELLPKVLFEGFAHPQHPGRAVRHLQSDAKTDGRGQFFQDGVLLSGKAAEGLAAAIGKAVRQRAAADQCRCAQTDAAQDRPDGTGRPLGKDGQLSAPAAEQLKHIPKHLRNTVLLIEEQVIQIAEDQSRIQCHLYSLPLRSVARKCVKYSGSSESNRRNSPVMGWTKPSVLA